MRQGECVCQVKGKETFMAKINGNIDKHIDQRYHVLYVCNLIVVSESNYLLKVMLFMCC